MCRERTTQLIERIWPDAMEMLDLGLAEFGYLLESLAARRKEGPPRGLSQLSRQVAFL